MDVLRIVLVALLGVVSYSLGQISGSELEVTARPGDNITLYCDCKLSSGVYIVWYRNCSHKNQPSLVLRYLKHYEWFKTNKIVDSLNLIPRFHFVVNDSSNSYDLIILNVTDSDEGLYYCGTEQAKVDDKDKITRRVEYRHGTVTTRIKINSSPQPDCCVCSSSPDSVPWMMALTPAITTLSSFLCFILVYHFCQKTDREADIINSGWNQDEDMYLTRVVFRVKDGQKHQQTEKKIQMTVVRPVTVMTITMKTVICAGCCCSLCVQRLLFSPLSSPLLWFIASAIKKLKKLKLISDSLKPED